MPEAVLLQQHNCTELGSCQSGSGPCDGSILSHSDSGTTSSTSSETSYATADASATLSNSSSYLPELNVNATAGAGSGAFATAYGVQQYTFTGPSGSIFDLDYNLHGSVGSDLFGQQLSATVGILLGDSPFAWDFDVDLATNVYEIAYPLELVDIDTLFISGGNDVNVPGTMSFELNSGDTFYIFAALSAKAVNGYADASNTFTMSFLDDTGLVATTTGPDINPVPVPAAAWLFGSALLGFAGFSKRRKKA